MTRDELTKDLANVLNSHGIDDGYSTPDYVLAEYLADCLFAYGAARSATLSCSNDSVRGCS